MGTHLFDGSDRNYEKGVADRICARIAEGEYTDKACLLEGMQPSTVYGWRDYEPDFAVAWQLALEQKAQLLLEKAEEALKTPDDDDIIDAGKGMRICHGARVNRCKAKADFYRWWAARCDKSLSERDVELEQMKKTIVELEKKVASK